MEDIKVENPSGVFDYILRGDNISQVEEAAMEFRNLLEHINHLSYNMTNTVKQVDHVITDLEKKHNIKIIKR